MERFSSVAQADVADQVDELPEAVLSRPGPGIFLGQDAFKGGIVALDGYHGVIHGLTNGGLFSAGFEVTTSGLLEEPRRY